jgi:hypothetical protein
MIWKGSAWINRWLTRCIYLENMVALDGEKNFIIMSTYLYLLKRCNLEIFWYNNVGENIFQIIFLQYCINARLISLELRHGMEHKRTEISYLDWSEWVSEWENTVWEEIRVQWLAVDLTKEFDSPILEGLFDWLWQQQWLLRDLSWETNWSQPEADLVPLSCTSVKRRTVYAFMVCFYIQGSLTLFYLTAYKIISI